MGSGELGLELVGIELVRVAVPLRRPWTSPAGTLVERESLLARVVLRRTGERGRDDVEGWGECAALPWPTYSPEYTDGALDVARRHLVPRLLAAGTSTAASVSGALALVHGHAMAKAALEMAVLDAELRAQGEPLWRRLASLSSVPSPLGPPVRSVPGGVSIGLGPPERVLAELEALVALGYRRAKLKAPAGQEAQLVAAVVERWPDLVVVVDLNGAYSEKGPEEAAGALAPLAELGVAAVEQPLGPDDLTGHARLTRLTPVAVCLDEAVSSLARLSLALTLHACSAVALKAGRFGGYLGAVRAHDMCAAAGVPVWCGGMVETGLGRAANAALASLPNFTLPGDMSASSRFFDQDLAGPVVMGADGRVQVPAGPGLGVEVDTAMLGATANWRAWYPRP